MKLKLLIILINGLFVFGCDYQFKETPKTEGNSPANSVNQNANAQTTATGNSNSNAANSASKEIDSNEPLVLSGTSESRTIPCGGREVEVVEDATANSYTLTGECKKLTVDGVSNKVSVEKVGEISVKGTSNKVTYVEGLDGKKPKITKSGISTAVDSVKELEKKAEANKQN